MASGATIDLGQEERDQLLAFRLGVAPGCDAAFEALFHRHQRAVFGWIVRIVRDAGTAEDLTIETFWRIHRAHARFDPARGFEPWARRIATHAAVDWLRARRPEAAMPPEFFAEAPARAEADPAITGEIRRHVAQALGRLPVKLRVAATLAVIEERPYAEVADALGISAAAVKLRVFRALRKMRNDLERWGITP